MDDVAQDEEGIPPSRFMSPIHCKGVNSDFDVGWRVLTLESRLQDIERVGGQSCDDASGETGEGFYDGGRQCRRGGLAIYRRIDSGHSRRKTVSRMPQKGTGSVRACRRRGGG